MNSNIIDERIYETPAEKDIENKNENNNEQFFPNTILKKDLDDFEKMKQKYFPKNFFSTKSPNSEYKVKYLNNYFNKNSIVKNLFGQYKDKNSNNNFSNQRQNLNLLINTNENTPPININDIKTPKLLYNNKIELDINTRYNSDINNINNINEQSLNYTNNSYTHEGTLVDAKSYKVA